jgi:uncharacterized protein DUF3800
MRLPNNGIDVFYVDESTDSNVIAMVAVSIPFLRSVSGTWTIVWDDHLENVKQWRKNLRINYGIRITKELKGSDLLSGRGQFLPPANQRAGATPIKAYREALATLTFLPPMSIVTVVGVPSSQLYGHTRLEAALYALLQRLRKACSVNDRAGMIFFDGGHDEYRKVYRKARKFLPTGSSQGAWASGQASKNLPLDNFTKDANIKNSKHCWFTQIADLISFATLLKIRAERGLLTPWQVQINAGSLFDSIPMACINTKASSRDPKGIVRL